MKSVTLFCYLFVLGHALTSQLNNSWWGASEKEAVIINNDPAPVVVQYSDGLRRVSLNPDKGILHFHHIEELCEISIWNVLGAKLEAYPGEEEIDIQHYPAGRYLVQLEDKQGNKHIETITKR